MAGCTSCDILSTTPRGCTPLRMRESLDTALCVNLHSTYSSENQSSSRVSCPCSGLSTVVRAHEWSVLLLHGIRRGRTYHDFSEKAEW